MLPVLYKEVVNDLAALSDVKRVAFGSDGVVFQCSSQMGLVAVKILFNFGIVSDVVGTFFQTEYNILKFLPHHRNIISILNDFDDRPTEQMFEQFPEDLKPLVCHVNGRRRKTRCIIMPFYEMNLRDYLRMNFTQLTVKEKLNFIHDIACGLLFLFENGVVHRDMKLDNLLIDLQNDKKIVICDFGYAIEHTNGKYKYVSGGTIGGNQFHLAPEISVACGASSAILDYSKQPSFELGLLMHEIYFGEAIERPLPELTDDYFLDLCSDPSHINPAFFECVKNLLAVAPTERLDITQAKMLIKQIIEQL